MNVSTMHRSGWLVAWLAMGIALPAAAENATAQDEQAEAADDAARAAWLAEHAMTVRSIDPGNVDFADLMPLKQMIGDARVVALGEQTHGDGATFDAKVRLVKFLHQEMGFDVLAWESGMFDCHLAQQAIQGGTPAAEALSTAVFPIWTRSKQLQPLFAYIDETQQTPAPMQVIGFDCQTMNQQRGTRLVAFLHTCAGRVDGFEQDIEHIAGHLSAEAPTTRDELNERVQAISKLADALDASEQATPDQHLAAQALRNTASFAKMLYHYRNMQSAQGKDAQRHQMKAAMVREPAMADTLIWLAHNFMPERKIIVWAASSHMTYNSRSVELQQPDGSFVHDTDPWEPMGNKVRLALGEDLYTVGFIAHSGEAGNVFGNRWPIPEPPAGSLDALCHDTGIANLFLDLRSLPDAPGGAWLNERLIARPRGYGVMRAVWPRVNDGMFFIKTMYPSEAVEQ